MTKINPTNGLITSPGSGQWDNKWSTAENYSFLLIPVVAGAKYRISGGTNVLRYAVLQNNTVSNGNAPSYATGFTAVVRITANSFADVIIPENGAYLYVDYVMNGNQRTPSVSRIYTATSIDDVKHSHGTSAEDTSTKKEIVVAASNAPAWQKKNADYVCDGVNDEVELQQAINTLSSTGGRIRLTAGEFIIDSFPNDRFASKTYTDSESGDSHRYAALMLPQTGVAYEIEGDTFRLKGNTGTQIRVSDTLYTSLGANDLRVVLAAAVPAAGADQINNSVSLTMSRVTIALPWNQKPIMCIDLMFVAKVYMQFINCRGCISNSVPSGNTTVNLTTPCPKAVQHCVGMRSTGGSNWGTCNDYRNIGVSGFYEGFKFSGEHVVGINLSAILCVYGYTFGNFTFTHASMHPMSLINCCDERCYNGPYFATQSGSQQIDLLQFNMEIGNSYVAGGEGHGQMATEKVPGTFRGRVEYTITRGDDNSSPRVSWVNDVAAPFWEAGHGHGFISRNMAHQPACTTSVRNTYKPDYLERIWDTTLGKEVICVDEGNKTWKDTMGNTV